MSLWQLVVFGKSPSQDRCTEELQITPVIVKKAPRLLLRKKCSPPFVEHNLSHQREWPLLSGHSTVRFWPITAFHCEGVFTLSDTPCKLEFDFVQIIAGLIIQKRQLDGTVETCSQLLWTSLCATTKHCVKSLILMT